LNLSLIIIEGFSFEKMIVLR